MGEQSITQLFKQLDPLFVKKYGAQWKRNTAPATVTPSVGAGAASTALTQHAGLDWIEAHPTKDPAVNRTRTYYSVNFGIIGGAGVDESNNILAMLNAVGLAGGGTVVICAVDPAGPIHIAKTISIYYSNVHVVFPPGQTITYEDKGSLRIMGDYAQITRKVDGTAMKLNAASTVVSNETVLQLSATDTALMDAEATPSLRIVRVGDKIVVRGQNDASGKAIEKDTTFVKSLAKVGSYWEITCTDELDYTFQATYPASEWPPDLTTGTTIYIINGSLITATTTINSTVVAGTDGSVFAVGDMVEVGDNRNEYAMNASAITGAGNPYKNPANLEQAQIIAISGNNITLDHALCRSASTTYYAFMALMVPVVNSTISGARISYTADGIRSANALQITYAMDCHIHDCYVYGLGGRKGHGLRISYSYKCTAYRNHIVGALYTGSGEGYGITIYYATLIMVDHNYISGCRHNILLQLATLAKVISNVSIDDRISGIDLHGVYSVRCSIQNNDVSRSSLNTGDSSKPGGIRIGNTSHTGGDHYNVIEGNTITGYSSTTADGIDIFAASTGNVIRNNTVIDCTVGLRFGLNSWQITPVQFIDNTLVEGNIFTRCTSRCIEIIAQPTYDAIGQPSNGKFSQITMINNISDGNDRHFEITGVVTTLGITDVVMVGNQVINPVNTTTTYYGISVKYTSGFVHIYDNNVSKAQRGIYLQGNGVCHIIGNKTANTVQTDPFTDGTGNTSVNYVDAMTGAGLSSPAFTSDISVTGTDPQIAWIETGVTANNTTWDILAQGENFLFRAVDDAYSTAQTYLGVTRTGNVIDSVNIEAAAIGLIGATTITGPLTVTGGFTGGSGAYTSDISVTNADPKYAFIETGVTANNTTWDILVDGMIMYYRLVNDAYSSATNWMSVTRSANTATAVSIAATAINLTGATLITGNLGLAGDLNFNNASTAAIFGIGVPAGSAAVNSGNGRELLIAAGTSDNVGGKRGGHIYLRPGVPTSPATTYGDVIVADLGGRFLAMSDTDRLGQIGRVALNGAGFTDYASFAHLDVNNTTSYALIQDNTGETFLNSASGKSVHLRVNNADVMSVSGTALTFNVNFGAWTAPTLSGTWANVGGSDSTARYRRVGDIVYLEGFVARSGTTGFTLFTLPSDCEPALHKTFATIMKHGGNQVVCRLEVNNAGVVNVIDPIPAAAITYLMLDGISFSTT